MVLSASKLPEEGIEEWAGVVSISEMHTETRQIHHVVNCTHLSPCLTSRSVQGLKLHVQSVHLVEHWLQYCNI